MIKLLLRERSLTLNLNSERVKTKMLVKIKLRLLPKKRLPSLRLRLLLKPRLLRVRCQKKRKNLLKPPLPLPMPPLKLMRDFLQNLPQLSPKDTHGTSEFEMHLSSRIQSSVISFQME